MNKQSILIYRNIEFESWFFVVDKYRILKIHGTFQTL